MKNTPQPTNNPSTALRYWTVADPQQLHRVLANAHASAGQPAEDWIKETTAALASLTPVRPRMGFLILTEAPQARGQRFAIRLQRSLDYAVFETIYRQLRRDVGNDVPEASVADLSEELQDTFTRHARVQVRQIAREFIEGFSREVLNKP